MAVEPSDRAASAELIARAYDELRGLARVHLRREREGHTLNATALVNEAYLRLVRQGNIDPTDRTGFFTIASSTMRRVLIDPARKRKQRQDHPHGGRQPWQRW